MRGDEHGDSTETSVFVCAPIPQTPLCDNETTSTVVAVDSTTTSLAAVVTHPTPRPVESLPVAGVETSLVFVAAGLVAAGLACLRRARL